MCGIAGAVSTTELPLPREILADVAACIRHRGPDGTGFHTEPCAALVSTRLSIIDVEGGRMPISNEDGTLHIVYNGECYNYRELRPALEARGHVFRTASDTEVVLHLYEEYGPQCLEMMNGQFAIAIWDTRRRRLFLARDRMGMRPLYYAERGDTLVFGSEVKALLATGLVGAEPDLKGIDALISFGCVVSPNTFFRGIRSLPPGCYLEWKSGKLSVSRYWDTEYPDAAQAEDRGEEYYATRLLEQLTEAVRCRLISDVPLGAYLSGGLDSSCVVERMAGLNGRVLTTFSIAFEDDEFDESDYADMMIARLGCRHESIRCSSDDIARAFPRLIRHAEAPLISTESAPLMLLSELARRKVKVVLTGEGSDELFGGYSFDRFEVLRRALARLPWSVLSPLVKAHFGHRSGGHGDLFFPSKERLIEKERLFGVYPSRSMQYGFLELVQKMTYTDEMLGRASSYDHRELLPIDREKIARMHPFNASIYLSQRLFLEGHLLGPHGDRAAMANSIEGRYPFLDHRVVEFCAGIPPRLKMKRFVEKYILRAAFAGRLPDEVLWRRKQPFLAPFGTPFLGKGMPEETQELLSERRLADKGYFDAPKVSRIVARLQELSPPGALSASGHNIMRLSRDSIERMLLGIAVTFVLSVQMWDETFMRGAGAAADVGQEVADKAPRPVAPTAVASLAR